MTPGKAFLCEAFDPSVCYYYSRGAAEPWSFFFVTFAGEAGVQMARDLARATGGVFDFPLGHPLLDQFLAYRKENRASVILTRAESSRLVMELLHTLLASVDADRGSLRDHELIRRAHDLVRETAGARLTVGDLARRLQVSREHLTRVFTGTAGEPPYRFFLRLRLREACNLLKHSDLSVKEVAARTGFGSISEFCRPFRRLLRMSPTAFRTSGIMPVFMSDGPGLVGTPDEG